MVKRILLSALACVAMLAPAKPAKSPNVLDIKNSITDNSIVFPESFEVDTHKLLEGWYMKNYTSTDDRYKTLGDVEVDDKTMQKRLAQLPTIIEMPYNQIVREYIERYTAKGRAQVAALLGLSNYYMPIFEQALEERGLPLELKYLPVIESSLDPNAVSRHGAAGLWQFMLASAKGMGMEVSSLVDERRDPYVSSAKAADFLQDLYATYGDWTLAIAAYNCGPGTVNKAIRRAGGNPKDHDFWSIYYYLPQETRGYVPAFIAANYVMNYYPEHNISPVLPTKPLVIDTLRISERINLNQISGVLDIPVEELRVLNPQFRADVIPGNAEHSYNLILPSQQIHAYIMSENAIREYQADKYNRREVAMPGEMPADALLAETDMNAEPEPLVAPDEGKVDSQGKKTITHKVKNGDTLASIAELYGVAPADIKTWNNLRRNSLRVGQIIRITADADNKAVAAARPAVSPDDEPAIETPASRKAATASKASKNSRKNSKKKAANPTNHKLKSGENLSTLAKKYGVSIDAIKKANNMKNDNLRAGESIKIPAKGTTAKKSSAKKSSKKKSKKRRR